jgi:hypothetical protein
MTTTNLPPPTNTKLDRMRIAALAIANLLYHDKMMQFGKVFEALNNEIARAELGDAGILAQAGAMLAGAMVQAGPEQPLQAAPAALAALVVAPDTATTDVEQATPEATRVNYNQPLPPVVDDTITTEQAAQLLGVDAFTLHNQRARAEALGLDPLLPFKRAGRQVSYSRSAVEKLIKDNPPRFQELKNRRAGKQRANARLQANGLSSTGVPHGR